MKVRIMLVLLAVMCGAVTAQAGIGIEPVNKETYDSGCVLDMSTAACFGYNSPTGTAYSGPRASTCAARPSDKSRCRECAEAYFNDGTPRGYKICAYIAMWGYCGCDYALTANCRGYGTCHYYTS